MLVSHLFLYDEFCKLARAYTSEYVRYKASNDFNKGNNKKTGDLLINSRYDYDQFASDLGTILYIKWYLEQIDRS